MKYGGANLTKYVQDPYVENNKNNDIKINKQTHIVLMDWKSQHSKDIYSPQISTQIQYNSSKSPRNFWRYRQAGSKIYM